MFRSLSIAINNDPSSGSAGGGIHFSEILALELEKRGHRIHRRLVDGLDLILIASFRWGSTYATFTVDEVEDYRLRQPNTVCVLRVNDSDEARLTRQIDIAGAARHAQRLCDHTVFISTYLQELYLGTHFAPDSPSCVIRNVADASLYNAGGCAVWPGHGPMKLVTHHFSPAFTKGFDFYERLDLLLDRQVWQERFDFTVIGALPYGFKLRNARHVPMLVQSEIPTALKQHHAYVTGARGEAAGMHAIEAIQCGLPIVYLRSGAVPEYCQGYGISFDAADFEECLLSLLENYPSLKRGWKPPSFGSEEMAEAYENLFCRLVAARQANPINPPSVGERLHYSLRRRFRRLYRVWHCLKA